MDVRETGKGKRAVAFLEDILKVCEEHYLSLSHEDEDREFKVVPYNSEDTAWIIKANLEELFEDDYDEIEIAEKRKKSKFRAAKILRAAKLITKRRGQ